MVSPARPPAAAPEHKHPVKHARKQIRKDDQKIAGDKKEVAGDRKELSKDKKQMREERREGDKAGVAEKSFKVSLGTGGVGKHTAGDSRTPLGTYPLGPPNRSTQYYIAIAVGYPTREQVKRLHWQGHRYSWTLALAP